MTSRYIRLALAAAAACLPLAVPVTPAAAIPVFDATNYAQNLLQAARALEQIEHQVQSLQNEATMLRNMERNLQRFDFPEVERLSSTLRQVDELMGEAKGIDFKVDQLDSKFRALFPGSAAGSQTGAEGVAAARARLDAAGDGLRRTMAVQSQVVENIRSDSALLAALAARSDSAQGSLQASQATNQLLALGTKQQLQLQSLIAAEYRSQAIERARQAQAEGDGLAATRRFLGSGKAYTPR